MNRRPSSLVSFAGCHTSSAGRAADFASPREHFRVGRGERALAHASSERVESSGTRTTRFDKSTVRPIAGFGSALVCRSVLLFTRVFSPPLSRGYTYTSVLFSLSAPRVSVVSVLPRSCFYLTTGARRRYSRRALDTAISSSRKCIAERRPSRILGSLFSPLTRHAVIVSLARSSPASQRTSTFHGERKKVRDSADKHDSEGRAPNSGLPAKCDAVNPFARQW